MARAGADVLLVERESKYRDRVRGEFLHPWGTEEVHLLGIRSLFDQAGATEVEWFDFHSPERNGHRNLPSRSKVGRPGLTFSHPSVQESLLSGAAEAGVATLAGTRVTATRIGKTPGIEFENASGSGSVSAKLVVGADGRASTTRAAAGFTSSQDPDNLRVAGALVSGASLEEGTAYVWHSRDSGALSLVFPRPGAAARIYLCWRGDRYESMAGSASFGDFIAGCFASGVPTEALANATLSGPLATFPGAAHWVDEPAKPGFVLVGDAASTSDPTWGHGMGIAFRDARVLSGLLASSNNWDTASSEYAANRSRYAGCLRAYENWSAELYFAETEDELARARRAEAAQMADPGAIPDISGTGPDFDFDEHARRRFFGE